MVRLKVTGKLKDLCVGSIIEHIANDRHVGACTLPRDLHRDFMKALREMCSTYSRFGRADDGSSENFTKRVNGFPKYFTTIEALFEDARISDLNLSSLHFIPNICMNLEALVTLDLSANSNNMRSVAEVIRQTTQLRDLNLSGVWDMDDDVIKAVAECCGKLEKLSISWEYYGSPQNPMVVFLELKRAQSEVDVQVLEYLKSVVVECGETETVSSTTRPNFSYTIKEYILLFPNLVEFQSKWSLRAVALVCSDPSNQRVFKLSSLGTAKQMSWPENTPHSNLSTLFPDLKDFSITEFGVSVNELNHFEKLCRLTLGVPLYSDAVLPGFGSYLSTSPQARNLTFLRIPSAALAAAILFCPNLEHVVIHDKGNMFLLTDADTRVKYNEISGAGELPFLNRLQKVEIISFDAVYNGFVLQVVETLLTICPNLVKLQVNRCNWSLDTFIRSEILAKNGWKNLKTLNLVFTNTHPGIVVDILSDFSKMLALDWLLFKCTYSGFNGFEEFDRKVWRGRISSLRKGNVDCRIIASSNAIIDDFEDY